MTALRIRTVMWLCCTTELFLGSVGAGNSPQVIRCEKCLVYGCINGAKVWRSQNGNDTMLWSGKNYFPECTFSPPPETWYHVCKKNNSVFMVTNDLALGVTFRFEAAGQHLNSERKSEEECPKLEPEPDRTANRTHPKSPSTTQGPDVSGTTSSSLSPSEMVLMVLGLLLLLILSSLLIGIYCKKKSNPQCCPRASSPPTVHVEGLGGNRTSTPRPCWPYPALLPARPHPTATTATAAQYDRGIYGMT